MPAERDMNPHIAVFPGKSAEYSKLKLASDILNTFVGRLHVTVKTAYFDQGQDWKWTTLVARPDRSEPYQLLSPAEQKKILYGTMADFVSVVCAIGTKSMHGIDDGCPTDA